MNNLTAIPANNKSHALISVLILLAVCLIAGTVLRVSLLITYPFVALFLTSYFNFKITPSLITMLLVVAACFVLSFFNGMFLKYKLLSLYYMLPFLLLLFSQPVLQERNNINYLDIFIKCLSVVVLINNIIGFIQLFINSRSDDSFMGIYSAFSTGVNGLSLINIILSFYYALSFFYKRTKLHLPAAIFFFICGILGFYGGGLIVCIAAVLGSFFVLDIHKIIKTVLIAAISITALYLFFLFIKPQIIDYNISNIKKMASFDMVNGPRKIISFYNYGISYPKDIKDFTFGSGPGTFNSRTAFMVGSPSYFSNVHFIKDENKPYYFENYAYPLWNKSNTIQTLYLDGFRNQPFSSILAFLGEYGLVFTVIFFVFYFIYYRKTAGIFRNIQLNNNTIMYFRFFKFLIILLPLLLLIDNFYENPEMMIILLLGIKFAQQRINYLGSKSTAFP
jgi:hypothetical protein